MRYEPNECEALLYVRPRVAHGRRTVMAKPWKKRWPYISKSGRKTYWLGFRDHDGVERTKSFASVKAAKEWADLYVSSERRGLETLRRFLLDLDAKDANCSTDGQASPAWTPRR
jgi:hypothetical protein